MNIKFKIHVSFLLNIQNSLNILIYMYDEYSKATKKHPSTPPHKERRIDSLLNHFVLILIFLFQAI